MLVRLRELALLQTADYSGRDLPLDMTSAAAETRIAVVVPFDPGVAAVATIRRTWQPSSTGVTRESEDVIETSIDFVQKEHIGLLVLGRPTRRGILGHLNPGIVSRSEGRLRARLLAAPSQTWRDGRYREPNRRARLVSDERPETRYREFVLDHPVRPGR